MQVNNPCAILMQETSKQFLATAKPQDKYQVCFTILHIYLETMQLKINFYTVLLDGNSNGSNEKRF